MQGLSMNDDELYKVEDEIKEFCKSEDVLCQSVKGPDYEQQLHGHKDYNSDTI
jgi:hypothetical protein